MRTPARAAALLFAATALSGCATVIEGTSQSMAVKTTPPGASCAVDQGSQRAGVVAPTPGSLVLSKSKQDLAMTCTKDGYQPFTARYNSRFVGTTFANFIAGGAVGFIVDAASGANFKYPKEVDVTMEPLPPAAPAMLPTLPQVAPLPVTPSS